MNKNDLRKVFKQKRQELFNTGKIEQISDRIVKNLILRKFFKESKNVLIFCPKGSEINVLGLLDDFGKNFFLPKVVGQDMVVCPYKKGDELEFGEFKILEPKTLPIYDLSLLDVVVTPALCADKKGYRLGWGGGYYDRFFKKEGLRAKKVVVIPEEFLLDEIGRDEFDIKCDFILTEEKVYEIK